MPLQGETSGGAAGREISSTSSQVHDNKLVDFHVNMFVA